MNTAVQKVIGTIGDLCRVYDVETAALKAGQINSFLDVQSMKLELAHRYQEEARFIIERGQEAKESVDPALRKKLENMESEFTQSSRRNTETLERMSRVMKRMHDRIITAARKTAIKQSLQYGATGKMYGEGQKVVTTGLIETA